MLTSFLSFHIRQRQQATLCEESLPVPLHRNNSDHLGVPKMTLNIIIDSVRQAELCGGTPP
jgi:hypothetical protein